MKLRNQTEAYLLAEVTQAWIHYRHLEETRTKYLSFFATVILTSAGFLVTLLKDIDKFDPAQLVGSISVFCFLLFIFSFFIWANISRRLCPGCIRGQSPGWRWLFSFLYSMLFSVSGGQLRITHLPPRFPTSRFFRLNRNSTRKSPTGRRGHRRSRDVYRAPCGVR